MDPHGALFFYLCLLAAQVVLVETLSDLLVLMKRLEQPVGRGLSSRASLEQKLLNASFGGHNLTLQTNSIQSLVFKLSCDFPGLSLSSTTLTNVSQVRGSQGSPARPCPCSAPVSWERPHLLSCGKIRKRKCSMASPGASPTCHAIPC
uniref:Adhesion G protein-coupled receptor G5 n=1 Tax=Mus musculus TaxID=10090 RepID=D6RJJ2_MOUSE